MNQLFKGKYRNKKSADKDVIHRRNDRRTHPERRVTDRRATANQPILSEAEIAALLHGVE